MSDDAADNLPPVPVFPPHEHVCGNCKMWQAHSVDARGWVGPCRVYANRGLFPPSAPWCDAFVPKYGAAPAPKVEAESNRRTRAVRNVAPTVVRRGTVVAGAGGASGMAPATVTRLRSPVDAARGQEQVELLEGELAMTRDELVEFFREATGDVATAPLAPKWEGGMIQILPGKSELQGKELPIDALFHKVVMVRDRLRVLEQKINAHPKLSDGEKVEMQHYITRVYGSLTNFNILFREKGDQFVGAKGDE